MLTDPTKPAEFRDAESWRGTGLLDFRLRVQQPESAPGLSLGIGGDGPDRGGQPAFRSNSFSGGERNRFLLQRDGGFVEVSLVSGTDAREDGRSFATLDYDRDGWLDIALASVQNPRLRLFRNQMATRTPGGRVLEIELVGANHGSTPSAHSSNRDAVGAVVTAISDTGTRTAYRRSLGEGLASQNARAVRVTLSPGETLRSLEVRWPSGHTSHHTPPPKTRPLVLEEPPPSSDTHSTEP